MRGATFVLLTATLLTTAVVSAREWRDSTGTHSIEAELVSFKDGNVWLKKSTGDVICVPEGRLSVVDREFLRSRLSRPSPPRTEFSLVELASRVEPAVVRIDTGEAIGSGFVVDPTGIVVTNHHVIEGARTVTATFKDGTSVGVVGYLGVDIAKDIILLRLGSSQKRPALSLRAELPRKGEAVATFGAPQGLDFSVSQGIVSAVRTDEEIQKSVSELTGQVQPVLDMVWVQTTAAISGGNSGGPLVDMSGEVVGVNSKTRTTGQNLNFAISCKDVSRLLEASSGNAVQSLVLLPSRQPASPKRSTSASVSPSEGFPLVRLPSGSSLSYTLVQIPKDWPECNFSKETAARLTEFPNGEPKSLHSFLNARLHGPSFLLYENGIRRWAADYYEGDRHGALRFWDENSEMTLFAEYVRGGKKGFVCVFERGMPWLVQEWDKNQMTSEYLVKWKAEVPTVYSSDSLPGQMETDEFAAAKERLAEVDQALTEEETEIKRDLADWFREADRQIKQQRAAALNVRKRGEIIDAIGARDAAEMAKLRRMWQRAMAGR